MDFQTVGVLLPLMVLFLASSAFFSASEMAFFSLSIPQQANLRHQSTKRARIAIRLLEHPDHLLTGILLGILTANVAATACATLITHQFGQQLGLSSQLVYLLDVIGMTYLIMVLAEVTPMNYALENAGRLVVRYAPWIRFWLWLTRPAVRPLVALARWINARFGREALRPPVTGEELRSLVDATHRAGALDQREREMLHGVFRLGHRSVREVMVPRIDMVCVPEGIELAELRRVVERSRHARLPVYRESVDQIVGVFYAKDLLPYTFNFLEPPPLRELIRDVLFVPESKPLDELLTEFQRARLQMAIVVDEYGGTAGLVTIEDLLEEIVGEIQDEYDVEEPLFHILGRNLFRVDGRLPLEDLDRLLGTRFAETAGVETVAGLVYKVMGKVPRMDEVAEHHGVEFRVTQVVGRRVAQVLIHRGVVEEEVFGEGEG